MFRKYWTLTLVICILLLFCISNVFAHMTGEAGAGNAWTVEERELNNKWNDVDRSVNEYHAMRGHVETLISDWESTKKSVAEGTTVTILTGGAAIISAGVTYISGGSFAPAAWLFYIAARKGLATYSLDSDQYLDVMGAAMSAMYTGKSNVGAAYDGGTMYVKIGGVESKQQTIGYAKQYQNYLQMCENHGIEHYVEGQPWKWTAADKKAIDDLVNKQNKTRSWYHADKTPSHAEHSITRRTDLSHWKVQPDLPMIHECEGGDCKVTFQSPWEAFDSHRVTCKKDYVNRSFLKGCNKSWYVCDSDISKKVERHKIRVCAKLLVYGDGTSTVCKEPYKNCTNWKWDHDNSNDWYWPTEHSDVADDSSGETTQNTVTPTPVQVDNSPNCEHCTDSCSACTQTSYHACGICETSVSGDHSLQSSCSLSNNWMRTCTVTNFYACQPHTCVFPTFSCGRKTCTQKVADPQEHRKISIDGVKYWSCNPSAVEAHMTRYCTKLKVKVKWNKKLNRKEGVWEICGEAFTRHNQQSCIDAYRRVRYHKE